MRGPELHVMAWRNLWRHKLRTGLTLAAIAFGGFFAVLMTAMQDQSFADFVDTAARMGSGHVTVQHPDYMESPTIANPVSGTDRWREDATANPRVAKAVDRISGMAMLSTSQDSFGAFFIALDPERETEDTFRFEDALVAGELFEGPDSSGIVLGSTLARNLGAELGDKVVFTVTDKEGEIVAGMERLSGIVTTNTPSLDTSLCLLPIGTMRELVGYNQDQATQVAVFLADSRRSREVAGALTPMAGDDAEVLTWDQVQPEIRSFVAMKIAGGRVMALVIALLVTAGIFNTLFVSVMERVREFGIMRAIGYTPGQLFRLVMWESSWLALVGMLVSAAITLPVYLPLAKHGIDMTAAYTQGGQSVEVAGVGFDMILRVGIFPEHVAVIAACIVLATMAAGIYPAWKVGRIEPVESINLV